MSNDEVEDTTLTVTTTVDVEVAIQRTSDIDSEGGLIEFTMSFGSN